MSEEPDPTPESDAVRRLLADARHDGPAPPEVADRMDRVLAGLASPAADPVPDRAVAVDAVVTRLPVQRRLRAAALLGAAAAIVVGGVVFAQQHPPSDGGGATAAAGGTEANSGNAGAHPAPQSSDGRSTQSTQRARIVLHDGRVVVGPRSFSATALAGQRLIRERRTQPPAASGTTCATPSGAAHVLPALYQRAPAALVYHRPEGSSQVVDLIVCGTARPIRSVTLPAP